MSVKSKKNFMVLISIAMSDKKKDSDVTRDSSADAPEKLYDEISEQQGVSAVNKGMRVAEFADHSGATFTLFEKYRTGYVGRLVTADSDTGEKYYRVDVANKVQEEMSVPSTDGDNDELIVEMALLPLMEAGWEITYYDAEHAAMRISDLFRK